MNQLPSVYFQHVKLGDVAIYSLSDGATEGPVRPGVIKNATMDEVRSALRAARRSDSTVRTPFTTIAMVKAGHLTLIDAGTGGSPVYGSNCGYLRKSIVSAGFDPASVRTILITHLHGDHIYGLFDKETLEQSFPNAEILVPAVDLKWWTQPGVEKLDLGITRVGLAALIGKTLAVWPNVRTFAENAEVLPGVHAIPAYGHSPGHTAYLIQTSVKDFLFSADVCVNPALLVQHPEWQFAMDQDPAMAAATRRRIFDRAATEGLLIGGTHWELPNVGTIKRAGNGYQFEPTAP